MNGFMYKNNTTTQTFSMFTSVKAESLTNRSKIMTKLQANTRCKIVMQKVTANF